MTADLINEGDRKPVLHEAPPEEVLLALQFDLTYQGGKHRGRQPHGVAIRTIAPMTYDDPSGPSVPHAYTP